MTSSLPSTSLFMLTLMSGTMITISSPQWIFLWAGLEINLLSFIPLMMQSNTHQETEAAIKYFLIQALGSSLLLMAGLSLGAPSKTLMTPQLTSTLMMFSVLIKMGGAPFHFWFPQVMASSSWFMCIILSTWQKVAPITVMLSLLAQSTYILITVLALMNGLVGGLGGINQTQMRPLLAYSSIGHMGWIIGAMLISQSLSMNYLILYILISSSFMLTLSATGNSLRNTTSMLKMNTMHAFISMLLLLSLGGLPPLLGFLPKWMILEQMMNKSYLLLSMGLVLSSLMNLFYYMTIAMNMFMTKPLITYELQGSNYNIMIPLALGTLMSAPIFLF